MHLVCLDLEGVLVPEIWISFSEATGIHEFRVTTKDEPDYDKLMNYRLELLAKHNLKLKDIQAVIGTMEALPGAVDFACALRKKMQLVILSDTFVEFAQPLLAKLDYPFILCNRIETAPDGSVSAYHLRQQNGKKAAVAAFKSLNCKVFASGDSYNDLDMIHEADSGCLFRAPEHIRKEYKHLTCVDTYEELQNAIDIFFGA